MLLDAQINVYEVPDDTADPIWHRISHVLRTTWTATFDKVLEQTCWRHLVGRVNTPTAAVVSLRPRQVWDISIAQ